MVLYRLGLDIGTNSIGWCVLHIRNDGSPIELGDWGSRIFNDGREPAKKEVPGDSSAVQRRGARGMRRRYDRRLMRKKATMRMLVRYGLMPEDTIERKKLELLNPLKLRHDALERELTPYEFGRALFHLQQRRGFKSNRKDAQKSGDNKIDGMKLGMRDLETALEKKTLGQFLYALNSERRSTRFHPKMEGSKATYDYYPRREMVYEEFNRIWEVQRKYHPELLTEEARQKIGDEKKGVIFYQRKLKPQDKGRCTLVPEEERMAWAMPSAQRFRIIKETANLRILSLDDYLYKGEELEKRQRLSPEQKQKLFEMLCKKTKNKNGSMTFNQIRTLLDFSSDKKFNLETPPRTGLEGDKTAAIMRNENCFGEAWDDFTLKQQDDIVAKLLDDAQEDETLVAWLKSDYGLTTEQAEKITETWLPPAYARFGKTVIISILPRMISEGMLEHEAIAAANPAWHHSQQYTGEIKNILPYYGSIESIQPHVMPMKKSGDPLVKEYGRINNPTVHIALNQLRRLMNKLKGRYGCWPQEITLEMARDLKKGRQEIADIIREIEKNTKQKEKWRGDIEEVKQAPATSHDFAKMKLWTELAQDPTHRKCVFTGEQITLEMLLSDQVEIEHILPKSQTLDDTSANKTLATRRANRIKGNNTPYEAFKTAPESITYESVWERAQILPQSKRWRFRQDAIEIFDSKQKKIVLKSSLDSSSETIDTGLESFAARQLNDTSYMAKIAKKYLAYACEKGERGVMATPGTLTGLLRKSWGLNTLLGEDGKKNRNDHRHHTVDALVIAMTTRSMVKKVADAAKKEETTRINISKILGEEKPWPGFEWHDLKARLDAIAVSVSHKPDHGSPAQQGGGTSGKLHEDTYYGFVGEEGKKTVLVIRRKLNEIEKIEELENIRDKALRQRAKDFVALHATKNEEGMISKDSLQTALITFGKQTGIRAMRMLEEKSTATLVSVKANREDGTPWKIAVGGDNQRAEIYRPKSGKKAGEWQIEFIKTFDTNQIGFTPKWRRDYPDAELIMTLYKGDIVAYEENGTVVVRKITILPNSGQISLIPNHLSKPLTKTAPSITVGSMKERNFRKLYVEIDGSVYDPHGILTTKRKPPEAAA